MSNITNLYGNGCSFMKDYKIINEGTPLYLQHIAEHYGWDWNNQGEPGSCNRRIIRTAARDALNFGSDTFMLISLTYWARTEVFNPRQAVGADEVHTSIKSNDRYQNFYNHWIKHMDYRSEITNLCTDLVMFTNMLRYRKIKYLIYMYLPLESHRDLSFFKNSDFGKELLADLGILNIFDDSLCQKLGTGNWFYDGIPGHLDAQGHRTAANLLISLIDELM